MSTVLLPPAVASAPAPPAAARRFAAAAPTGCRSWAGSSRTASATRASTSFRSATRAIRGERFMALLKFYRGAEEPVFTYLSDSFAGDQNFRFEGAQLLAAIGESHFEGIVEITARSLDHPPTHFPWIDSWLEFWSDDGAFSGSVPGFVFKGGTTKRVMSGKWQHWPGAVAERRVPDVGAAAQLPSAPDAAPTRPVRALGAHAQLGACSRCRRARRATSRSRRTCPTRAALLSAEGGIGSLRIWSAYKLPGFVMIGNRNTGVITSFDHTVPYAGAPVE